MNGVSAVEDLKSRDAWLAARRSAIGASDAPAILGVSPWASPMSIFAEKLGITQGPDESEAMRWGSLLEAPIAEHYAATTGHELLDRGRFALRRNRERPWLVATLDREIVKADRKTPAVLEIKTSSGAQLWEDEPPAHVQVQVQHQLAVTGWPWAAVAVLLGGRTFRVYLVERHDAFIAVLLERLAEFWRRLELNDPPPVDGSDATKQVLAALYPKHEPGVVVALPGEASEWDAARIEAMETIKAATKLKDEAEARIKQAIGEAEAGVLPDGTRYSWKTQERAGYTVEPTTLRVLRRTAAK